MQVKITSKTLCSHLFLNPNVWLQTIYAKAKYFLHKRKHFFQKQLLPIMNFYLLLRKKSVELSWLKSARNVQSGGGGVRWSFSLGTFFLRKEAFFHLYKHVWWCTPWQTYWVNMVRYRFLLHWSVLEKSAIHILSYVNQVCCSDRMTKWVQTHWGFCMVFRCFAVSDAGTYICRRFPSNISNGFEYRTELLLRKQPFVVPLDTQFVYKGPDSMNLTRVYHGRDEHNRPYTMTLTSFAWLFEPGTWSECSACGDTPGEQQRQSDCRVKFSFPRGEPSPGLEGILRQRYAGRLWAGEAPYRCFQPLQFANGAIWRDHVRRSHQVMYYHSIFLVVSID